MPVGYAKARNIVFPRSTSWPHCLVMKILTHISRFLLDLIFLVFGLNGFLHFIPTPLPSGVAGQFLGSMFVTKYLLFVFAIQLVLASGGVYSNGPAKQLHFQEPYLPAVLGFMGLTDIEVVRVEGVAMSAIGADKAVATATAHSREILARAA
jgi:Flavodoxin-like fold